MGEVYLARDTKLNRDVALKTLPDTFTHDPERLARFRREAQVLATLNHPHIAAIYGLDEAKGQQFLVLELVDGETLDKRVARGAIPVDEALGIARQIAEALEAAHEKGIIHRDLKPANIALTGDGHVKVLDFGLAKATDADRGAPLDVSNSPTITSPAMMTGVGVILGTAAYMSPEQAKGRAADKRSDIWAFGCVLYEMLSGRRAFDGEDATDVIAAVVRSEPDWRALPPHVPEHIRLLLRRCLEKDRGKRVADISTARFLITEPAASAVLRVTSSGVLPEARPRPLWKRAAPFALTAVLAGIAIGGAMWMARPTVPAPVVTRFSFPLGDGQAFTNPGRPLVAISADGRRMVYVANNRLYLRSISELEARPLSGTENPAGVASPIFSPDGQSIVFYSTGNTRTSSLGGLIKRIGLSGGAAVTICEAGSPFGMSWDRDTILFGAGNQGIMRVAANGGTPEVVARVKDNEQAHGPQMLPDGQSLLFTLATERRWDTARIVLQRKSGERKTLVEGGSDGRYVPTGHLVYAIGGTVFAIPFDDRQLEVRGGAVPIVVGVKRALSGNTGAAQLSVSATGSIMYIPGPPSTSGDQILALVDRTGTLTPLKLPPGSYQHPRLSPDGNRVAFSVDDGRETNIWVYGLSGAAAMRRLTVGSNNRFPVWTSDGQRIAFQSDREKDFAIWWQRADTSGNAERLTKPAAGTSHVPESWFPRGDSFLFSVTKGSSTTLWTFSLPDQKEERFNGVESSNPLGSVFSPDGRWVSYYSNAEGVYRVFVQPFPPTGDKYLISKDLGAARHPMWSPDGKEVFYVPALGQFEVVALQTRPTFTFGNPVAVPVGAFVEAAVTTERNYDILPDGNRFITVIPADESQRGNPEREIRVVENWFEELKARVPVK
jgi:serine/threonine-protein kinase